MKKVSKRAGRTKPSAAALREMPEIDFAKYRVRPNPYAARIAREGVQVVHDGPSIESLAEIPEADFERATVRRNPYAAKLSDALAKVQYGRGRPSSASENGPTPARSLRLPLAAWEALEAEARDKRTTVHALLREVVVAHLQARLRKR